jgi:glyoxylase-like metal-dependent hydrolase (beta-lactamase superfamily II)
MRVKTLTVGMFQSNCYLVSCERTNEAIVIDAGGEGERILDTIEKDGLNIQAVINTHGHIDHVSALAVVAPALSVPILMHEGDLPIFDNLSSQAAMFGVPAPEGIKITKHLRSGDKIEFGDVTGEVIHTPGHSPGGISVIFRGENPQVIFTGDTLFMGSIGRTDLYGGDFETIIKSLREIYLPLPDGTVVYPGHGDHTTIGTEKQFNPFLSQLV